MDTFQFYITKMGFVSLVLIILSLLITTYLVREKSKAGSIWLLISFFGAVIANNLTMLLANGWVFWGDALMPAQDAWILLGGVALGQFAYHFPEYEQKREARLVLIFTGGVALFAVGYSVYYAAQYFFDYSPGMDDSDAYYLLMPLMTLFLIGVFLRRAVYYAEFSKRTRINGLERVRQFGVVLVRPQNRATRTLRNFALALSLGLLPGLAYFLKGFAFIPPWLASYMLSIGSVLALAGLALVYLDNSGEQTSFIGKVMGISLVSFLLIFGAFGVSIIDRFENWKGQATLPQVSAAYRAVLSGEFSSLPPEIAYIIAWPPELLSAADQATISSGQPGGYRLSYLRSEEAAFDIQQLLDENRFIESADYPQINPVISLSGSETELLPSPYLPGYLIIRYMNFPYGSTSQYTGYLFKGEHALYEIGLNAFDRLESTHNLALYLLSWTLVCCLIVLLLFPGFYNFNLVRPLNNLLNGVKQANRGVLDVQIPVQYEDEIGYLTHSFNNLASSLWRSNQARDGMETELHQMIDQLRLSEEKFSKAFHSSPVAMMLQNLDDQRYTDVNAAFTMITGYTRDDAVGNRPMEMNLYPTAEEGDRVRRAVIESDGRLNNLEFSFRRKSGQTGTGLLSSEVFDLHGVATRLGIVMDISERKQAEDKIRLLNTEMERRVAERSWQLSTLLDLAFLVSQRESQDHILLPAMERILEISAYQAVCIHTFSDDKQYLRLDAQAGLEDEEEDQMCLVLPGGLFADWLSRPKDLLLFSDLKKNTILPDAMQPERMRSCLVIQLLAQEKVRGTMFCYREDVHVFSLDEISLFVAIAGQLSTSLENQRLHQEAEREAIHAERQRLARDLHDSVTQSLYGLTLFARSSKDALKARNEKKLTANLEQIEENAVAALKEMRLLLYQMQPQGLEDGLMQAVILRLNSVERRSGIRATCQIDDRIRLSPEVEQTLFLIVLEALNNSLKHAQASQVRVTFEQTGGVFYLEIADDGCGFDGVVYHESANSSGMGLQNMRARAAELSGELEILSSPGNGTRVRLRFDWESDQGG
jgi:PAS domain S-box-containing protein